jgi:hypothetical protein
MERTQSRPLYISAIIFVLFIIVNSVLAKYASIPTQGMAGVSSIYPAIAIMIVFTLWFGGWGAIAAYLGCFIGSGILTQMPLGVNLYFSLADLWEVLIPLAAFIAFKADIGLSSKRDWIILVVFGWLLNNLVGAAWGSAALALGGVNSWSGFAKSFFSWFLGDLAVNIILTSLLLKYMTPVIRRMGLTNNKGF